MFERGVCCLVAKKYFRNRKLFLEKESLQKKFEKMANERYRQQESDPRNVSRYSVFGIIHLKIVIKTFHPIPWRDSISRLIAPASSLEAETIPLDHATMQNPFDDSLFLPQNANVY
jgi:hypothetical protein